MELPWYFFYETLSRLTSRLLTFLPDYRSVFQDSQNNKEIPTKPTKQAENKQKVPLSLKKKPIQISKNPTHKAHPQMPTFIRGALAQEHVRNLVFFREGNCRSQPVFMGNSYSDLQQDNHERHIELLGWQISAMASGVFPIFITFAAFCAAKGVGLCCPSCLFCDLALCLHPHSKMGTSLPKSITFPWHSE